MLIKKLADIASSEITPRNVYLNRRSFLVGAAATGAASRIPNAQKTTSYDEGRINPREGENNIKLPVG